MALVSDSRWCPVELRDGIHVNYPDSLGNWNALGCERRVRASIRSREVRPQWQHARL
jgi:hypothetical protein